MSTSTPLAYVAAWDVHGIKPFGRLDAQVMTTGPAARPGVVANGSSHREGRR